MTVPLTWMQHRMLETCLTGDDPAMFVTQVVLPLSRRPDLADVRRAWRRTGAAFAALRSRLVLNDDPGLVVDGSPEPVAAHELADDTPDAPDLERALRPWLDRRSRLTGAFTGHRSCRLDLVQHARCGDALVFSFNHAVLDGRSMSIVLAHLAAGLSEPAPTGQDDLDRYRAHGRRHAAVAGPLDPGESAFWTGLTRQDHPAARECPAAPAAAGRRRETCLWLSAELSGDLAEAARAARVTVAALTHVACLLAVEDLAGTGSASVTTAVSLPDEDDDGVADDGVADDAETVGNRLVYLPFRLPGGAVAPVAQSCVAAQRLLADLYAHVWSFPRFVDRCTAAERVRLACPSVALAVGNYPTPAALGGAGPAFSVERPGAPLAVYAVPGERFAFQVVGRGGDPDRLGDALVRACVRLAGSDRPRAVHDRWTVTESGWTRAAVLDVLRGLWADALRVPAVGDADRFVTLGGLPLAASRVVRAVERETGVRVPAAALLADLPLAAVADLVLQSPCACRK
jgi:condensation domain-containing protein/phosphopantetheine binding protein